MKTLVLCVDRDNDIGVKTKVSGPIVGEKKNLEVAQSLAIADPEDSDLNAIYGAVKLARELKCEVATVTGDSNVGIISDEKLTRQIDQLIADLKPESLILVTDGAEDAQILPILQSRIKITSVKTIVVRQSKELEKAYFTILNFLKEVSEDPNLARLMFAVPGLALVLLWIVGFGAIRFIFGIIGIYLIIKGMGFEEEFFQWTSGFIKSISAGKISSLTYILAFIAFIIGIGFAYGGLKENPLDLTDLRSTLDSSSVFLLNTKIADLIVLTVVFILIGRIIDDLSTHEPIRVRRNLLLLAFLVLLDLMLTTGAKFWIEEYRLGDFLLWAAIGIVSFGFWIKLISVIFMSEIQYVETTLKQFSDKDVYSLQGERLGKIGKVLFKGGEMYAVKVGSKLMSKDEIVSAGKVIVVKK